MLCQYCFCELYLLYEHAYCPICGREYTKFVFVKEDENGEQEVFEVWMDSYAE
jgi:rRNA maturation endonuclease Nob1